MTYSISHPHFLAPPSNINSQFSIPFLLFLCWPVPYITPISQADFSLSASSLLCLLILQDDLLHTTSWFFTIFLTFYSPTPLFCFFFFSFASPEYNVPHPCFHKPLSCHGLYYLPQTKHTASSSVLAANQPKIGSLLLAPTVKSKYHNPSPFFHKRPQAVTSSTSCNFVHKL